MSNIALSHDASLRHYSLSLSCSPRGRRPGTYVCGATPLEIFWAELDIDSQGLSAFNYDLAFRAKISVRLVNDDLVGALRNGFQPKTPACIAKAKVRVVEYINPSRHPWMDIAGESNRLVVRLGPKLLFVVVAPDGQDIKAIASDFSSGPDIVVIGVGVRECHPIAATHG